MEITRHFTATTFVVYKQKTLLHLHRSLKMWLPPGGHIDRDELPHVAAIREVKEETGLDVELIHTAPTIHSENAQEIPGPRHLLLENINPFHQHIDMIYFARASSFDVTPDAGESVELRWFTIEELEGEEIENDIRLLGKEALGVISKADD
ncbi:MAG: NUDIX domain-containing protein [Candidatus Marinimicrobia bacterium]|jgi:ADP-ribose pyrophosphatase YjhB (NUDIX family)|nr:NUDIX domain-containing protein [Candidatus Neomarinimicrobiota bacterium]MBT3630137.1 NUDIX domain-containing protein [Candidatus Neomarinimicrobiota bacterium]MBT3826089.1 NUDIX domain-containing protein [Candidatus Neomarinimicrobiota bacterium]MBT4132123.1 NUDIX domain-containing protein [Candidatus Neomarinimicrobiota bacterium]MBT4296610.1 NUDIX domain-containing protein [Candidatus Neomarinimicrobiota bacterium]